MESLPSLDTSQEQKDKEDVSSWEKKEDKEEEVKILELSWTRVLLLAQNPIS